MRVLLVEDEVKIAAAIKRGLEQESYAVDAVHNADDGLSYALTEEYDLIILDRMLPGLIEGSEICREVRANGINVPILMLTAKDQVRDRVEGLNSGADDYLVKPFAFDELLARIRALLRRPQGQTGDVFTLDDLMVDTGRHEVTRAGQAIKLSSREYALLEYMIRNANILVSKQSLVNHVWNYDADILPNTVEVYIGYLRNKIDRPFSGPALIQTVRGFGYKLASG